jgi:hypothetical protein
LLRERPKPLTIRWIAFFIRKRASDRPDFARQLTSLLPLPRDRAFLPDLDLRRVPAVSGLYWLQSAQSKKLYVGETVNLQRRFEEQLALTQFNFWNTDRASIDVRFRALPDERRMLWGNQAGWIARWKPCGNYAEFAAL